MINYPDKPSLAVLTLDYSLFKSVEGQTFHLADFTPGILTLKEVSDKNINGQWYTFSLLFSSNNNSLSQATYQLSHPELGKLDVFLVPIGKYYPDCDEMVYECVFNLPADDA